MEKITAILNATDVIAPFLAIIFFMVKWKKLSKELKLVFLFCCVQFICNAVAYLMAAQEVNNYVVYIVNTFLSFLVLFSLFVRYLIRVPRLVAVGMGSAFVLVFFVMVANGDGITSFNSVSSALLSLLIVAFCLYFFYIQLVSSSPEISVPQLAIFWCVVGIFTYFAGSFFIFITYKYLIANVWEGLGPLWRFHNLLLLICCIYIVYGILCKSYQEI